MFQKLTTSLTKLKNELSQKLHLWLIHLIMLILYLYKAKKERIIHVKLR